MQQSKQEVKKVVSLVKNGNKPPYVCFLICSSLTDTSFDHPYITKTCLYYCDHFQFHFRVCTRICFSFATIFANLIFFVPFSLTLSQILSQILAIFRKRIILSEKKCSFTYSFNCSNRFKSQYNVKCVGDLKLILRLIFKTSAVP